MPSNLGDYEGAASKRNMKIHRAIQSFIDQDYQNRELVIISDGCSKTVNTYQQHYKHVKNIHCKQISKQPLFSGSVRQAGIEFAQKLKPDIFCGLDIDDMLHFNHLSAIAKQFNDNDWVYYDDYWKIRPREFALHRVNVKKDMIGTSSIAWKNDNRFSWQGMDGWAHDWKFISEKLLAPGIKYSKIINCGYVVCHIKTMFDN